MQKNIVFYLIAIGLLIFSFLLFNDSYRETVRFTKLTENSNIVYGNFQDLSRQINNAAVVHPDLLRINDSLGGDKLFFTDSAVIKKEVDTLKATVKDPFNIQIAQQLDGLITSELSWIIKSNVPDSIIHHKSLSHIQAFKAIDSLINNGISHSFSLINFNKDKLNKAISREKTLMLFFIFISAIILFYTIISLARERFKTKVKERELETAFNRISDAVVSVDSDWRYTFLNDAALSSHPLGREQTLGKVLWDMHPEMKGTIFWDKYHEAMASKEVIELENYYPPMDTWFSVKIYPSANGLTIFYKDITEKKVAAKQLLQTIKEVADYKFALDETSIVAITDQKGSIKYVNENFCMISKYSSEELLGQDHRIINSGYHPKEFIRNLWTTIASGKIWKGELKNKAKDGTIYWVDTTIVPFLDDKGKPYQYVAIRTDITERKRAEAHLVELNSNLQKHAKELAVSNADLEQFAYVASHDLQEPLRMVTSFLTQLEKKYGDVIDEKGKKYIAFAVDGAKRMRQIILDLLEFSRVGRTEDTNEELDLNELVEDIKILFRKQIEEKNAVIQVDRLPVINAYKTPMRQVFQNLISNALKYTRTDVACYIHIAVKESEKEWQFEVSDNGIGIAQEFYDKIFIIFQRLHNREEFSGTGMGLAVTKKIIENDGGKIWVRSEEGKGTGFYFTILKNIV
jgi:PAS domain S-box-containing protein